MNRNVTILLLSILNFLIRAGSDAQVPTGSLVISIVVFVALHVTGWMSWTMVYRPVWASTRAQASRDDRAAFRSPWIL